MRYPYNNFPGDWNLDAGFAFGDKVDYGYHDGWDINDKGGGNSDLGKPIFAIADGVVTSVHNHTNMPTFGNHLHYQIDGPWGTKFIHHAHCLEILVKVGDKVKEGQVIANIGKSGTLFAHDHFALKKKPTGIDAIAHNIKELNDGWENPLEFVKQWMDSGIIPPSSEIPMNDQTKIPAALLGWEEDLEIQAIRGKLGDLKRLEEENPKLRQALTECQNRPPKVVITVDLDKVSIQDLLTAAIKKIFNKKADGS